MQEGKKAQKTTLSQWQESLSTKTVKAMREWAKDCGGWGDIDFDDLSDNEIIRGIARNYSGGIEGFLRDGEHPEIQ